MTTESPASSDSLLYIIHAAADRNLAIFLKGKIDDIVPNRRVFLASKAGEIPTGEDWLAHIRENLKSATSFLLLLTPRSIERHWIWCKRRVSRGPAAADSCR